MLANKTVFVAMSGGVDSSVAAALLQRRGFRVVGVYFKPWSPSKNGSYCDWKQDRLDAMRAAAAIGIPFKTWDFSKTYGQKVAQYMIDEYRRGLTPNPDVMCNKEIKFGLFLKKALVEGADYIATGHYARLRERKAKNEKRKIEYQLLTGRDRDKDQSYFLWTLTQRQLQHCLFPIGEYTKPAVRQLARKFGLANHAKPDSQGVCFVGQLDVKDFLKKFIPSRRGPVKLLYRGLTSIIGWHDGVQYYTIGQRHGLDIKAGGGPYYVVAKDVRKNIIYVSTEKNALASQAATVGDLNWLVNPKLPLDAGVKIRYRTKTVAAKLCRNGSLKTVSIKFKQPARAIASGQSAVFYRGQQVLGGGVIL